MPNPDPSRRGFLQGLTAGALAAGGFCGMGAAAAEPRFRISLAEWSLHRMLRAGELTNLDFPRVAREDFGINAVEYVSQFFKDKADDQAYLADLNRRCADHGVRSLLIMCDGEGDLGDPDAGRRERAVANHHRWVEAAKTLGCHAIRVNAASSGSFQEQQKLAADGLSKLGEYAARYELDVLVENHGGLSSHGAWLVGVLKEVNRPNVGALPDFGNFVINRQTGESYDRYQGVKELMPWAKAVSAKSHEFDSDGNEIRTDYFRMMEIVLTSGYRGYVGIEWEGGDRSEYEGIRLTKQLLQRVRDRLG